MEKGFILLLPWAIPVPGSRVVFPSVTVGRSKRDHVSPLYPHADGVEIIRREGNLDVRQKAELVPMHHVEAVWRCRKPGTRSMGLLVEAT